ncbi:putative carbonyl reductase [Cadophora sp. DSE1049]|nr:putative carbonyl reductase [Cadophora sp. DSE1049]
MAKTWDPMTDTPDLHGKVAVVTGANSGIGLSMAKILALRGAKVYFTARSEAKAEKARTDLQIQSPELDQTNVKWLKLDVSDLNSITAAADELMSKESKVHILINNAGVASSSTELFGPGWESHMTVNYIGPFLFTNRILPLLKKSCQTEQGADVRIITVSSVVQANMLPSNFKFQFDTPQALTQPIPSYPWQWRFAGRFMFPFDMIRYAVSKAAAVIFAQELQRKLDEQGLPILSISVHPGEVATQGVMSGNYAPVRAMAKLTFLTPDQGAVSPLFAATAMEVRQNFKKYKGQFLLPGGKIGETNPVTKDDRQVKGLWDNTTKELKKQLQAEGLPLLQAW